MAPEAPSFDLDKTILRDMARGPAERAPRFARAELRQRPCWGATRPRGGLAQASTSSAVAVAAASSGGQQDHGLHARGERGFAGEHRADGSFMGRLGFCHDHCAAHYSAVSPRVMLLQSVMGVGTSKFPLDKSKVPQLASMPTPAEMKHLECFPSFVRLLSRPFLDDIEQMGSDVGRLRGASFRRAMDNGPLELYAEEARVQLDYQLVHLVDLCPWWAGAEGSSNPAVQLFLRPCRLPSRAGQLRARIAMSTAMSCPLTEDDVKSCERASLDGPMTAAKQKSIGVGMAKLPREIGHSLEYELTWSHV